MASSMLINVLIAGILIVLKCGVSSAHAPATGESKSNTASFLYQIIKDLSVIQHENNELAEKIEILEEQFDPELEAELNGKLESRLESFQSEIEEKLESRLETLESAIETKIEGKFDLLESELETIKQDINDCVPNPCKNDGRCSDGVNSYTCACTAGYYGKNCDTNNDDCASKPCKNGGKCFDRVNDFACTCAAGWTGKDCGTNINDCDPNPCKNGGRCSDGVNSYTCACTAGYSGKNCNTKSDELSECPPPYIYNASLNLCWRIETKMLNWSSARLQCASEGGDLIVLDTPEKIAYIQKGVAGISLTLLWILVGGDDQSEEGKFKWVNGSPVQGIPWSSGQPDDVGNEDCMAMLKSDGKFYDIPCTYTRSFLCELN